MKNKSPIPAKLKKLVKDAIKRHAWNIGVSHFQGDILWMEEDKDGDSERSTVLADMNVDPSYLKATMRIYPAAVEKWKKEGDEFIEWLIAHEVAHIATDPMYQLIILPYKNEGEATVARESLTETIGRMSVKIDKFNRK